ncbi:MAG: hypothetical protein RL559_1013, partial [Pseudomonadota bacterium]
RLGPGVWQGEQAPVAQVFAQPLLDDGRLLDAALGLHFAVIADEAVLKGVSVETRARWRAQGVHCLPASDREVRVCLQQLGVRAVLLRPDRYIAGVAHTSAELEDLSALLPDHADLQAH